MRRAWTLIPFVAIGWSSPPTTQPDYQVVTMMQWAPAPAIAAELRRIDPAADDWEAEVFAAAAHRTLDELKPQLVGDATTSFDGPVTVPAARALQRRYTDGTVDVRGWNSANGGPAERRSGIEGLRRLLTLAGNPGDAQIEFEMIRIVLEGTMAATEVLTRITGTPGTLGQAQRVQQNARLRIDWT